MPVNLYYTQKVRGFQQEKVKYSKESVELRLKRTKHQCSYCGSTAVTVEPVRSRAWLRTLTDFNGQIHSNLSVIVRNRPLVSVITLPRQTGLTERSVFVLSQVY